MTELALDTLVGARDAVAGRRISAVELVQRVLHRIEQVEPAVQAFNGT